MNLEKPSTDIDLDTRSQQTPDPAVEIIHSEDEAAVPADDTKSDPSGELLCKAAAASPPEMISISPKDHEDDGDDVGTIVTGDMDIDDHQDLQMQPQQKEEKAGEEDGRERLKKHRKEVAGRVWIPDMWGQEGFLKDWVDCTSFDATLISSKIMSARAALVEEGRRSNMNMNMNMNNPTARGLRIENRC